MSYLSRADREHDFTHKDLRKNKQLKHRKACISSVIEHGMMSLSFQTAVQKNEAKLSSFMQFENEMESYRTL